MYRRNSIIVGTHKREFTHQTMCS